MNRVKALAPNDKRMTWIPSPPPVPIRKLPRGRKAQQEFYRPRTVFSWKGILFLASALMAFMVILHFLR